ncbi:T9SS-dependent M36 family metallopeptidase [Aquimarina sp. 2201CG14-23]|uniref:T9SS-dependent M36 family metallopeptidase n=1 Tax=Aquimarina mycalae TaxID=3040073 RepID=UPI002477D3EF|nr:T9SS-dependent M36 family metallopeptidase [Aquimarina sp. 2201CG14-23]MDH7448373.1 T9SS-dependent M36 family metallopeptidase [Aquimarina sp. 2201CG14-23]
MKQQYIFFLLVLFAFTGTQIQAQSSNLQIIKSYLLEKGMAEEDISELQVQRESFSNSLKATNVYVIQRYKDIPVYNAIGSLVVKNGKVVSFSGKFYNNLSQKINTTTPVIEPVQMIRNVAADIGIQPVDLEVLSEKNDNELVLFDENISQENIPVNLMYVFKDDQLLLCWNFSIYTLDGNDWHSIRIDAVSGDIVDQTNWMTDCSFDNHNSTSVSKNEMKKSSFGFNETSNLLMGGTYNVFPIPSVESPNHGNRVLVTNPSNANASPFGWHDTDGITGEEFTTTQGNNVLAAEDIDANNVPGSRPDGGAGLVFDFPLDQNALVENFEDASITNLFYANNVIHDVWYQYGFDETSGNFQFNNYGKGGIESDEVFADAHDGSGFNNANFGTPPDGFNPRMQMFLWNPVPDPAIDTFIVNNGALTGAYVTADNVFNPGHVDAPESPDGLTADLVLVRDIITADSNDANDACDVILNFSELRDKIAVVRRGNCNFDEKVARCQTSGAVAVIVVNNMPGNPTPMGGDDGTITIPAIMIGSTDGEALITEMATTTISATISDAGRNIFAEDSSFDNGIVIHEYGHGISTRLTGGADNSGCLSNVEQMGEGWSDWFALMMTIESGDLGGDSRGIGTYASGQPITGGGIRPFPYSTNMTINPVTYASTNNQAFSVPHGIGSVWASVLWDLTWALIERDGFDPDLYNGTGGNNLAMQLVIDGLKMQSCNPGFVDGRDGILMADQVANSGANACLIWEVFARRGVGWSANQGTATSRTDQVESFDIPPSSQLQCLLSVEDFEEDIFRITPNPSRGNFVINVSRSFGESNVSIVDINGRVVLEEEMLLNSAYNINAENLRTGIYLLQIVTENGNKFTTKIAIQ